MRIAIFFATLALAGCDRLEPRVADHCERRELFAQCMKLLPSGPASTKYNDWDEVVEACDTVALKQSRKILSSQQPQSCQAHKEQSK